MNVVTNTLQGYEDPLLQEAKLALPEGEMLPVSFLQRRFRLGYSRALRLYDAIRNTKK